MNDNQQNQGIKDPAQIASQPITTVAPVSGRLNKEAEQPATAFITHSEKAPVLDKELKEAGVELVSDKPELKPEHEKIGIKHSLENNVPSLEPTVSVKFPLTATQIQQVTKTGNTQASAYWLSQLIIKIKKVLLRTKQND